MKVTHHKDSIPIFMKGCQRNQTSKSFCRILAGDALGYIPQQGLPYQAAARSPYISLHKRTSAHAYCQVQAIGEKKKNPGFVEDVQEALPIPRTVGFIYEFEQRGLCCLNKCSPLVVASQL